MWTRQAMVAWLAMLLLSFSCKPTVEGESKAWEKNMTRTAELKALYPGFGAALDAQLAQAKTTMEAAKAIGDEQAKAKKMDEANDLLDSGFVSDLRGYDAKKKDVQSKSVKMTTVATDEADRLAARTTNETVQRQLFEIDRKITQGAPDPASAAAIMKQVYSDLTAAESLLDQVIQAAQARSQAAQPATAPQGDAGGAPAPAPAGPTTWKCEYCGNVHAQDVATCPSCGAPRGAH